MTIAAMVFRMAYVSALAAGVLIAVAGLLSPGGTPQAFAQVDTTAPTISSIAITSDTGDIGNGLEDDGVYGIGDRIRVTVTFSEDINVTGSPRLELDIGGVSKPAEYESAEGSNVVFGYTVIEGDADDDGIAIGENKLAPNGGSIKDAANNEADLSHEVLAAQNDHRVDGIRPTISDIRLVISIAMFNGTYVAGETLVANVDFNEDVLVIGSPQLALDFQGTTRLAEKTHMFPYCEPEEGQLSLCGSSFRRGIIISFGATILEGDEDNDGVAIAANALSLNGGTIEDAAGNGAVLTHDAVAPNSSFLVDGVPPTISAIAITSDPGDGNSYGVGDQVEVTVTFSENVRVTTRGYRPRLMLDIGGKTKVAKYVVPSSPDPMKFMKFTYTVEAGDNDNNGIAVGANKLQLLGTKVYDTPAGNPANITHQALPDDPEHMVSTPATGTENEETSNNLRSGLVKITGEARVGATLTADPSGIIDDDEVDHAEFLYLWLSDRLPVGMGLSGEHPSPHYELQTGDAGDAISVRASFYDDEGNYEVRFSDTLQIPPAPNNNFATGAPTIDGAARVGETLTADTSGIDDEDELTNVVFAYQWMRSDGSVDADIAGANGATYTLVAADEGKAIKVVVSFTDDEGNPETMPSEPTGAVAPDPGPLTTFTLVDASTDPDTLLGALEDGDTLTLAHPDNGSYGIRVNTDSNDDNQKVVLALSGAKDVNKPEKHSPYSLYGDSGEDNLNGGNLPVGSYSLTATAYDANGDVLGTLKVSFTVEAQEQTAVPNNEPTGAPTIRGTAQVGETLTVDVTGISDDDGLENAAFTYQWTRSDGGSDSNIQDATGSSYTLVAEDEGRTIKVTVSFTDAEGNSETLTSDPTGEVEAKPNTEATGLPTIDGIARVGATLTADTSGINDDDELTSVVFAYQWLADDAEVAGATGAAYTLVAADEGKAIKVVVSFMDDEGNPETLTSEPTGAVAPEPGPLTGFTVVDASTDPDTPLGALVDEGTLILGNPTGGEYGIRVDTDSNDDIRKVELALSGAEDKGKTEWEPPYSLYGDSGGDNLNGGNLPVGSYTLTATAYDANGNVSGTLTVSFTVEAQEQSAVPNNDATGLPTIDGFARVGETLTADTSGIDDDDGLTNVAFSYQWVRSDGSGDTNIHDATGSSYTLAGDDEGRTIKVTVSFTDGEGNPETLTSDPTGEVAPESGPLTAFTLVDTSTDPDKALGTLEDGRTLTLAAPAGDSYGIRVNTDSNDDIHKVELALSGAKTEGKTEWEPPYSLYGDSGEENLTGEDLPAGSYDLKATAYDANNDEMGTLKVSFSVAYAAPPEEQQPAQNTLATGAPTIDGIARVGGTLTVDTSGIHDDDGLTNVAFSYQWLRGNAEIASATGETYTLVKADEGKTIKVTVSFTDAAGNPESLTSDPTGEVEAKPNTEATGAPTIDGEAQVGQTLTADTSGIHDDDGLTNVVFSYQWLMSDGGADSNIQDATGSSYTLTAADEGMTIKVKVSFTDAEGNAETLTSDPTGEVEAKPNTRATGAPTIDGIARVGETLTADTSGIDDDDGLTNVAFSYQWVRSDGSGDTNIHDATGSSYTLAGDDEGRTIKVTVSFTDGEGNPETLTSDPTGEVAPESGPLTAFTLVDTSTDPDKALGTLEDGRTLTLAAPAGDSYGIRVNTDSNDDIHKVELALSGAKTEGKTEWEPPYSLYGDSGEENLTGEDLPAGSYDLKATAYDANNDEMGTLKVSFSVAYAAPPEEQQPAQNTLATGAPTIDGIARVGGTLTVDTSGIHDDDGLTNVAFSYQWLRGNAEIASATGETYTLVKADEGKTIKVTVSFTDAAGNPESLTSDPTGEVEAKPNTEATGAPTIDGEAQVGQTLTADTSGIHDDDGLTNVVFSYQWLMSDGGADSNIQDATGSSYTLTAADEGMTIKVKVSFTDAEGNAETLTSDPTGEVEAKPNTRATGAPTIDGIARVGETLTADTSGIDDDDGLTDVAFSYQWVRNDGGSDTNIQDATGSSYVLTEADEGKTVKVTVSFTDAQGNHETLTSDATGVVTAKPNTEATGAPAIDGIARVGETLTADTSDIDDDGLDNAVFAYQWSRSNGGLDTNITGANGETYTQVEADEGHTIKVTVSFTDAQGNPETLTSDATGVVEAAETVPGRPQDLDGEASAQGIALTWTAPDGAAVTEYVVYRGKLQNGSMNGKPMTKHATISATAADMAYTDAGVEEGQEYRYRVAAVNSAGEGRKSAWINIFAGNPRS